jgi:hypothetical protein
MQDGRSGERAASVVARAHDPLAHAHAPSSKQQHQKATTSTTNNTTHTGPFSPPLVGNLGGMLRHGMHEHAVLCAAKYGPVFKVYLG